MLGGLRLGGRLLRAGRATAMQFATAMDAATRATELPPVMAAGWKMVEGREALVKTYKFANFNECWQWMSAVALAAEKLNHHPEWSNSYDTVEVIWSTHDDTDLSIRNDTMLKENQSEKPKAFIYEKWCSHQDINLSDRDIKMAKWCDEAFKPFDKPAAQKESS